MTVDELPDSGQPPELTADECIRAGMYWFGQGDLTAAEAWWERALYLEPSNMRAQECLRLLARTMGAAHASPPSGEVLEPDPSVAPA